MTGASETRLVEEDTPDLLKVWVAEQNATGVGDRIALRASGFRQKGWHVEELKENANYNSYKQRYSGRQYVIDLPRERLNKPEAAWDFLTYAMVSHWESWSTLFWEIFLGSKQEFDRVARGHYLRLISPDKNRIYDVVIIRNLNPAGTLIADPVAGAGVERLWKAINPPRPDEFPRESIFGPTRFVEPSAAKRFALGQYTVLGVYARRYFAGGSFLHAEYGKSRGRDTYILTLLTQKEIVVLQTVLSGDTNVETILDDLRNLIGAS
jgi:hypothetical protein